jgi:hypothetical protein
MSRLCGNLVLRRRGGAGTKRHQGGEAENWKKATEGHRFYLRVSGRPSWHRFFRMMKLQRNWGKAKVALPTEGPMVTLKTTHHGNLIRS